MKRSNIITFIFLWTLIFAVIVYMFIQKEPAVSSQTDTLNLDPERTDLQTKTTDRDMETVESEPVSGDVSKEEGTALNPSTQPDTQLTETDSPAVSTSEPETKPIQPPPVPPIIDKQLTISMDDALFIGDSRTVGIMEYAGIQGADFFCNVGMSVYNIHDKPIAVPNVGKVALSELLDKKTYGKIYIMLGINEVGYSFSNTVAKYDELIEFIQSKQPDAYIFIQANLHVSTSRSEKDKVINNTAINGLNAELSKLADGKNKFYLDVNPLFDDASGGLSSDKSADDTHLYAKYYAIWGNWIINQTASIIGEK